MAKFETLGQFEQLVLAAVQQIPNPYGVTIHGMVERVYGKPVKFASIYTTSPSSPRAYGLPWGHETFRLWWVNLGDYWWVTSGECRRKFDSFKVEGDDIVFRIE